MRDDVERVFHPSSLSPHPLVMWNDRLRFAESVASEWSALAAHEKEIATAALQHIDEDPIAGAPLFEPLRGLWSYRTGHLRIIYRIMPEARFVVVLSIARAPEFS